MLFVNKIKQDNESTWSPVWHEQRNHEAVAEQEQTHFLYHTERLGVHLNEVPTVHEESPRHLRHPLHTHTHTHTCTNTLDFLVHGQVTIIFVVSVGLSVCLFVCAEFFSAVYDPI